MNFAHLRPILIATSAALFTFSVTPSMAADATQSPSATETPSIQVPPSPKFDISEYKIEGNTLLAADDLKTLVKPFTGSQKDFGDVQQALEALQDAYLKRGYNSVRVTLPEQELDKGVVLFTIIEQKVSTIKVEGNKVYSTENVLRGVPSLHEGETPNIRKIGSSLKFANDNPTKQTAVLFTDSEKVENTVEATVKVIDEKPWKAFVTLDNTGNRESGHGRVSFGYQNFNMFDRDQRLTAQFITNPHYPGNLFNPHHDVKIFAFAYTIPFYSLGDSLDLIASYSDTTSSTPASIAAANIGSIAGKGLVLGAHYNHQLPKLKDFEEQLSLSIDNRATRASTASLGGPLSPAVTTTPIGLTYSGTWAPEGQQLTFSAGAAVNISDLAAHGGKSDFDALTSDKNFRKFNYSFDYLRALPKDWQFHAALNGQITTDHLVSVEQYRAGGADTVRGFHESAVSGDKGFRLSLEAITPDFGKKIGENFSLRALVFTDQAHVTNNKDTTGVNTVNASNEAIIYNIGSIGAGLRLNYGKHVSGRFDYGYVTNGDDGGQENGTTASRERGDKFAHISLGFTW